MARGARCERMADMDTSAIYRPLRHSDTRVHQCSHTRANTLARNTLFLNEHTPTLHPLTRLTHAPYMHRLARCRRTLAPTCWFTDTHTHTHSQSQTHTFTPCALPRTHKHLSPTTAFVSMHIQLHTQTPTQTHPRTPSPANTLTQEQTHTHTETHTSCKLMQTHK